MCFVLKTPNLVLLGLVLAYLRRYMRVERISIHINLIIIIIVISLVN
jgi:hypothetical protein